MTEKTTDQKLDEALNLLRRLVDAVEVIARTSNPQFRPAFKPPVRQSKKPGE